MYELLQEEDMWSGLWQKHARYRETNVAIAYEQQGFFEQAQVTISFIFRLSTINIITHLLLIYYDNITLNALFANLTNFIYEAYLANNNRVI